MSLHDELLVQARALAVAGEGGPSQANFRRAVSAAYYALFHLLIAESVALLIPGSPPNLQARVTRSFAHREMKDICAAFSSKQLREDVRALIPQGQVVQGLREIAGTFCQLQQARQKADYDVASTFTQPIALLRVEEAERAFRLWSTIEASEERTVFLTALAFASRWSK